ncbi:Josephin-domain-containing protein [Laetiporus sulphureus 93-53]|uniref:ubiquitinyl hydrolase 1 n=1 Tax=Laetiporus sulphureus 93-53 TaxID=1314785 RepID=A0A165GQZ2_9APHY|nr:Josephin-domain-containing protein [Laetiporus sulphureus 93-53]KZT10685.1 Josephin-domain-containing protein [Laetiporus sulphureus 93-53]
MATIEDLIPLIYHEQQEPGSMLCAQHALNSLLQGNYFTAPDLSTIALSLDEQEAAFDEDNTGQASTNMDDTGFFSVQVLDNALQVWGLTLVHWRSERMRPFQQYPHMQLAFILNLQQHWYTLRRFGIDPPDPDHVGHWFNLNSFLQQPEWISKLYLDMVLQQAETDGYSVFAVVQVDPDALLALPRTSADHLAAVIPDQPSVRPSRTAGSSSQAAPSAQSLEGFEDEDMELQAALQASLMGMNTEYEYPHTHTSVPAPLSSLPGIPSRGIFTSTHRFDQNEQTPQLAPPPLIPIQGDDDDEIEAESEPEQLEAVNTDPVAASMARNRAFLQAMQREQEAALQEGYPAQMARFQARHTAEQEEEEEMLRRAIAESEAMARERKEVAEDEQQAPSQSASASVYDEPRVYDDEDAELQAALKASLESVPEGFTMPETPPPRPPQSLPSASTSAPAAPPPPLQREPSTKSESEGFETESEAEIEPPQEQLSMEEIRRRRLARFGG